jgi:hypothetical protein
VGEKQTFLVQARSYKTISGSDWAAILCLRSNEDSIEEIKCNCRVSNGQVIKKFSLEICVKD